MTRESSLRLEGGRPLQVLEVGDRKGLPVFALHGTPGCRLLAELASSGQAAGKIRTISYDRPGYGGSAAAPGRRVVDEASHVAAIADHLGVERFAVWGWSGGGAPALACAAALPKRVVAAVSFAGLAPYGAAGLDWFAGMGELNLEDFRLALQDPPAFDAKCREEREELVEATPATLRESLSSLLSEVDRRALTGGLARSLARQTREGLRSGHEGLRDDTASQVRPFGFDAAAIRVPVQLWHGGEDRFVPFSHGHWLAAHVPGAEVHLEPDEGHLTVFARHLPDAERWLASKF